MNHLLRNDRSNEGPKDGCSRADQIITRVNKSQSMCHKQYACIMLDVSGAMYLLISY